ncbi:metal-dependent hydrolase [Bradyrhizobium sp. STM 3561]|uniref:metal-dependent hydrolase n=1 Tax=unclassified Bradyrhizobium TaxID=2631580 RepID=UPI003890078E
MDITWFGHSNFRIAFSDAVVLIDPFFSGNSLFAGNLEAAIDGVTHVLVTHGHADHVGDTIPIADKTNALVIAGYELGNWLAANGVKRTDLLNVGGTIDAGGFQVTATRAYHSSAELAVTMLALAGRTTSQLSDLGVSISFGNPNGFVIRSKGQPTVYHMGDTDVFSDMSLINELYKPDVVIVPVGDRFTMGAEGAALAVCRYLKPRIAIPCHYGGFPILEQTPARFVEAVARQDPRIKVIVPKVGDVVHA